MRHWHRPLARLGLGFLLLCLLPSATRAEEDLSDLSLEDLLEIEVTTPSKAEQSLLDVASAITVLTAEDIRRAGHLSIPESLRMVPGLHVAHLDANRWVVTSRGFSSLYVGKLLVLMDGRSVYSPLFSGVFWNLQDTFLDDLDRIEVVRGPGAAVWGANAMNGVINILTRDAEETQGALLYGGGGKEETAFAGGRYGGRLGEDAYYRVYAKGFLRDSSSNGADDWSQVRGGFRIDWHKADHVTLQGDLYAEESGSRFLVPFLVPPHMRPLDLEEELSGGNLLFRWTRTYSQSSDLMLQAYFDRTEWEGPRLNEERNTFDVEINRRFPVFGADHELSLGLDYRVTSDRSWPGITMDLVPSGRTDHLVSGFLQLQDRFAAGRIRTTFGTKLEYNTLSGFEIEPSARVLWVPAPRHRLWGAITGSVRTPNRMEHDGRIDVTAFDPGTGPVLVSLFSNDQYDSERALSLELGYRTHPLEELFVDVAAYYSEYDRLRTFLAGAPIAEPTPPHTVLPQIIMNGGTAETYGLEITATWVPESWAKLTTGYTFFKADSDLEPGHTELSPLEGSSPQNQLFLLSSFDLPRRFELDLNFYYVDSLPALDVPSYLRFDVHLAWKPSDSLTLDLGVQNILDDSHLEFRQDVTGILASEVETAAYLRITKRF